MVLVKFSESFADAVASVGAAAGFEVRSQRPDDAGLPSASAVCFVLAGGAEPDALDWLAETGAGPRAPFYVIGAAADHRFAARAVGRGAADYFVLPEDLDLFRQAVERAWRSRQLARSRDAYADEEQEGAGFGALIGRSEALARTVADARRVAAVRDVTALIGGETGTGKELLARAIHNHSSRAGSPFVEINCAAIPANLLESELFGHERGAFTGAVVARPGLFETADGGTVFLDEIGHLPLELQPKLLRVLESRSSRRVGGGATRSFDVRVIAATHVDLAAAVADGVFREDLYYRLNVVTLMLPPLRDRGDDVVLLAEAFAGRLARQHGLRRPELSPEVIAALKAHLWAGNIRELRNVVERALVLSPPGTLELGQLFAPPGRRQDAGQLPFPAPLTTIIRSAVLETLARTEGNKSEAARRLGISRPRLQRILDGDVD